MKNSTPFRSRRQLTVAINNSVSVHQPRQQLLFFPPLSLWISRPHPPFLFILRNVAVVVDSLIIIVTTANRNVIVIVIYILFLSLLY